MQVSHLPVDFEHWGPPCNVSTGPFEHAQGHLRDKARMNTRDSEEYGFEQYTTWQAQRLAEIQHEDESEDSCYPQVRDACMDLIDNKDGSVTYWGVLIERGSVVARIMPAADLDIDGIIADGTISEFFQYYYVRSINIKRQQVKVYRLKCPVLDNSVLLPFPLEYATKDKNDSKETLDLCVCNRVVATVPGEWNEDDEIAGAPMVIPTRFV